jgi:hypothetical protein
MSKKNDVFGILPERSDVAEKSCYPFGINYLSGKHPQNALRGDQEF